jgi:hypothetical protein
MHSPEVYVPIGHVLHGTHARSVVGVQGCASRNPPMHADVHVEHTASAVAEQAVDA